VDLAPPDFFLFWHGKDELAGITLDHSTLKKELAEVTRNITAEEFATTFCGDMSAAKSVLTSTGAMSRNHEKLKSF
jgi:hypothetical protein